MGSALPRHLAGHMGADELLLGSVLVRPSTQVPVAAEANAIADDATDVSIYHPWKKTAVKGCSTRHRRTVLIHEMWELFTAAEVHVPEMVQHLYSCKNHRTCEQLHY